MENVVLAEEFARAKAPLRADFFGDTLVGPTILQWGTEEQKKEFLPKILNGEMAWCQGFSEPNSGSDLASLKTTAVPRRRRVGHLRPEGLDHPGAVRRLLLPAGPHRTRTRRSTRASPTCWCPCSRTASRCGASPSPTAPPSSTRCSSTAPAARSTTSSAGSTTAGWWPTRRSPTSGACRRPPATGASRRSST